MKKILTIAFLLSFALVATAEVFSGTCGANLTWTLNTADSTLTISGTGAMTDYNFVTKPEWYRYRENISHVIFPTGMTSIGAYAFSDYTNTRYRIKTITIPDNVTTLGAACLGGTILTSIRIHRNVSTIGTNALGIPTLEEIIIDGNNATFSSVNGVLYNKAQTTLLLYPRTKADSAYVLPSTVKTINNAAFAGSKVKAVTLPASTTNIGFEAFSGSSIMYINVNTSNANYSSVDGVLFNKAKTALICYPPGKKATSYSIPSTVKTIKQCAFNQGVLTSIQIPSSITTIERRAFWNMPRLTSLTIPASVTSLEADFAPGYNIQSINVASGNPNYCSVDGVVYNKSKTILLEYPTGSTVTAFTVPNGVQKIESKAFYRATALKRIYLPESLNTIEIDAFRYCTNLLSISIPAAVTSIGSSAFSDCIGLLDIIMNTPTPPSVGTDVFYDSYDKALAVPCGATAAYRADPIFGQFENIIEQCYYDVAVNSANPAQGSATGGGTNLLGGSVIELIATPAAHYHFTHWSDGNTQNPRNYLVEGNATISAFFAIDKHTITLYAEDCATPNTITNIPYGESIILTADCYRFARWSDGNTDNPRTVTVTGDATYTAIFEKNMLVLDDTKDNSELLTNVLGEEWDVLLDNRTLRGAMWNTLCLPFDVPTLVGTPLEGATVAEFVRATGDAVSGLSLEFAAVSSLQAGKPYLLTPTADVENPVFEQVTISAMDGETILGDGNVHFVGILEPTHLLSGNQDYLFVGANNRLYYPAMDDVGTMRAFRAYFNVTGPALVGRRLPARVVLHEQTPTNLTETSDDVLVRKFIRQGILIIERDGIEYNAQGMRLSK